MRIFPQLSHDDIPGVFSAWWDLRISLLDAEVLNLGTGMCYFSTKTLEDIDKLWERDRQSETLSLKYLELIDILKQKTISGGY